MASHPAANRPGGASATGAGAAVRISIRILGIVLLLVPTLALHGIWRLAGRASPWPKRFLAAVARICGVRVNLAGEAERHKVLYLANHLSWLDIPVLCGATGCAFVSKDDVAGWPLLGWLAALNDTVFISRTDRMGIRRQIEDIRTALTRHRGLAVFPEGTTGDGHHLLPFKPTLLKVLDPPPDGIRVQPLFIDYGADAQDIAWHDEEPFGANAKRLLARRKSLPVTIHFLEAFDPVTLGDRKAIAAHARREMLDAQAAGKDSGEHV